MGPPLSGARAAGRALPLHARQSRARMLKGKALKDYLKKSKGQGLQLNERLMEAILKGQVKSPRPKHEMPSTN